MSMISRNSTRFEGAEIDTRVISPASMKALSAGSAREYAVDQAHANYYVEENLSYIVKSCTIKVT